MESYESTRHHKLFIDHMNLSAEETTTERNARMLIVIAEALATIADILENRL